jgi:hypothetical protein
MMPSTLQVPTVSSCVQERRNIQLFKAEYELAVKIAQLVKENLYKSSSDAEEINLCAVRSFSETMINNWRR